MKVIKSILKLSLVFIILDLLYFIIVKIVLEQSGDTDTLLMAEGFVFCSLLYAYLGIRYLRCVRNVQFAMSKYIFAGIGFFAIGFFVTIGPVHIISGLCDLFGVILFGISNESNVQIVLLWIICSVVTALICYDVAEKKYREANKHDKTDDNDL